MLFYSFSHFAVIIYLNLKWIAITNEHDGYPQVSRLFKVEYNAELSKICIVQHL